MANTVTSIPAPTNVRQLIYSPTYARLIVRNSGSAIALIDVNTAQSTTRFPNATFTDVAIAPSGRYVFGADYGGENIGYGTPANASYVHRLDLTTGNWETRIAYIAGGIQVVADEQFVLRSNDQFLTFTNNAWGTGTAVVPLNASSGAFWGPGFYTGVYSGDFRYDSNTGRLLHGNAGSSSQEIQAFGFSGNDFVHREGSGIYGTAQGYGTTVTLASDGSAFYYGRLQVDPLDVSFNRRVFAEPIYAATGSIAFGNGKFFDAQSGNLLGTLGFDATIYGLNPNGQDFWAFDAGQNLLRKLTFASAPCTTPSAPIGVSASLDSGTTNIVVTWTGISGAGGYNIYMAKQPGVTKTNYASLGGQKRFSVASPYTELTATAGTYYLVVTALNDSGESAESAQVQVTVPDTQAPAVPTGVTATAIDWSQINVTWNASSDNVGIYYYQIYRGGAVFGTIFAPQVGFTDTGLSASTQYSYSIAACDASFNCSAPSNAASATTPVRNTPDPFSFASQTGVARGALATSNRITISGVSIALPISITGGEYSINDGAFTSNPGTITNGQSVVVRLTASASFATTTIATLTVGGGKATFSVTTVIPVFNAAPYFPLTLGISKVMRRNGVVEPASTITDTLVVNNVTTVGIPDASDGSITYFTNNALGIRLHRVYTPPTLIDGCGTVAETDTYGPPALLMPATVSVGQTVNSNGIVTADFGVCGSYPFGFSTTSTLESVEQVNVPAGQFEALKVRVNLSIPSLGSSNYVYWFASGIGPIKALDFDGSVIELVSTNQVRTTPDEIILAARTSVPRNSTVISNPATITGVTSAAAVSISGGEYSINSGAFTSQAGSVTNGQSIRVRLASSPDSTTTSFATLTVGSVAAKFSVTTESGAPGVPLAVSSRSAPSSVVVKFTPPASNGGLIISGYTVTCTSSDGGAERSRTVGATETSIQVSGLTNGKRYSCTVQARNAAGTSPISLPSNEVKPFDLTSILNILLEDSP